MNKRVKGMNYEHDKDNKFWAAQGNIEDGVHARCPFMRKHVLPMLLLNNIKQWRGMILKKLLALVNLLANCVRCC